MSALVDWLRQERYAPVFPLSHDAAWDHAQRLWRKYGAGGTTEDRLAARDAWRVAADASSEAGDRLAYTECLYRVARLNDGRLGPGEHVHRCPSCYKAKPCAYECNVEPDQELDDGTLAGDIIDCADCVSAKPAIEAWTHAATVKTTEAWLAAAVAIEAWGKDPLSADHARWLAFAAPGECYACAKARTRYAARTEYSHTCAKRRLVPHVSTGQVKP